MERRCKLVLVGDCECGKSALLHVFAKGAYLESYTPTVFENYTASFEIHQQRTHLNMWDTSGSCDYDNVRPLAYAESDAVLLCFDISRPHTLHGITKKWLPEALRFCPAAKLMLVGLKLDLRTDTHTLIELAKNKAHPVTYEQGTSAARHMGALAYAECTSRYSENSVRDVFHVATVLSVNYQQPMARSGSSGPAPLKHICQVHQPISTAADTDNHAPRLRRGGAKSCSIM
ncbi:rho-related GTP-binding protein RhoN-like [Engraulis encrasicolus]|uniref:rho-related GTP-binding protein RhoN-like n=1 Tax=Engraulis encrasicolus TaxID=184585 RepID=UPI002FD69F7D